MTRRTAAPLALCILLLAPASASALEEKCAKTATVTSGADNVQHFSESPETGNPLAGKTIRRRSGFYKAEGTVRLDYANNTYAIGPGSIFKIVCYGKSAKAGLTLPALDLLVGQVKVTTAQKKPGGVVTNESLLDPRDDPTMTFTASRTLRSGGDPTTKNIDSWMGHTISQAFGTTRTSSVGKPIIGVTPYVGSKPGVCRYVQEAKLTSSGRKGSYFTGSATYKT